MRPSRPVLLPAALALVLGAAYALAACGTGGEGAAALTASGADWTYVGDEACASCHADLYTDYHRTGMGRSVSVFDPETAPERFGADGASPQVCADDGYCYTAFVRGDTLYQRETRPDTPGWERVYAASHVVGSGNATRSYLMTVGDADSTAAYVTEMPLTWYVEREIWDLSPGYDQTNQRFERPINLECMTCHNARPEHATSQNAYGEIPLGISCERCHGPGSAHVAAYDAGGAPEDPLIVNPASLSAELALDVCQQCHLTGHTVYAPGEDPTTYRPGRPLSAHRSVYVRAEALEDPESFGIASHAERMRESACFMETAGTDLALTCTTCHDPHTPAAEGSYNTACQSCHAGSAHLALCSREGAETPQMAASGDCVSCHMRTAGTSDIPHVSFTDHWIRRDPPPSASGTRIAAESYERDAPFTLVELTRGARDPATTDVEAGIAYVSLWETEHPLPHYLTEATVRLRRGLAAGAERTDARIALGRALMGMDSTRAAERELVEATRRDPQSAHAAFWLGVLRNRTGRSAAALAPLAEAVRLAPRYSEARREYATALAAANRLPEAIRQLERLTRADPERHPGAWNDLGLYRLQSGQGEGARQALRRAVALDPTLATAWVNLGAASLSIGDLSEAERAFSRALRYDAQNTGAMGNLALIRAQQGRPAEARALLRQLLAVDPTDARARALLAEIGS
ncbi:MAG TPA: tetratricopeptide repeat protein [Bacteroidetes bacterium]|nr:tetratricopeptide repeat protein [Bacteroidota bacterium]